MELGTGIEAVSGIGKTRAKALEKVGVRTLGDLLSYFPRGYEDRSVSKKISQLLPEEAACVEAMVASSPVNSHIRRGLDILKLRVVDESGAMELTFFNRPYLKNLFHSGESFIFYGRVEGTLLRKQMTNPVVEKPSQRQLTGCIVPLYPLTAGITQQLLFRAVRQALDACGPLLEDCLPEEVRQQHALCYISYAYENIHFPQDWKALDIARRRLIFEELFFLSAGLQLLRKRRDTVSVPPCHQVDMDVFYRGLSFPLTGAQRRCIDEALQDMQSGRPMNRLCQGDVGSGKTMVAAACVYFAARNGLQAALMAPTEILARQHYQNLAALLEPLGVRCALLTGATGGKARRDILDRLAAGEVDFCIGTHALLNSQVQYRALGLVVTDEQHRFGVNQRSLLSAKAEHPHVLVMSATPIPRTLALILYGDLELSTLDELPPGRQKVDTFCVTGAYHPRLYAFVRKLVQQGRQAYIVCPLVEESEEQPQPQKAVTDYARRLQQEVFPDLTVGLLHGRMSSKEKDAVMSAFAAGEIQILVATTVIEVGVDVPNAALMIVENAERFGLSQLHQLRGRVGRGAHKSYCILVSDAQAEESKARLRVMTESNDGFHIAEEDLRLRGPGDFFGSRQHGLPGLKIADLHCDMQLLQQAQQAASALLQQDPDLQQPRHEAMRRRINALFSLQSDALN